MSAPNDSPREPEGADAELAARLSAERPVPGAGFRGALGRRLAGEDPGYGPRPPHLRAIVAAYLAGGGALMLIAALVGLGHL